ncbi:histidine phosphatase family protein [Leucobacter celer]|uniref:histidine phosphatase family protein n=1 Tax=Leucobacter celer TaxID=668625 RepID=UPI000949956D|nr:histidine phosphatase family protein [Leucobacter celer]
MSESPHPHGSIVVVRHGETDWNIGRRIQGRTEIPLNDTGRAQAAAAAVILRDSGTWTRVITSPLGRAAETARIIADALGLEAPGTDHGILERDFGPAEGLLVDDAAARWPGLEVPGAEPLPELAERGARAFVRHMNRAPGSIVVAHGALIRAALSTLSGTEAPRILNGEAWALSPRIDLAPSPATLNEPQAEMPRVLVRRLGTPAMQHAI